MRNRIRGSAGSAAARSSSTSVTLRAAAWHGDRLLTVKFPGSWSVRVLEGDALPGLSDSEIRERLATPHGTPALRSLASNRTSAVIVVDDYTRPTPTARILPPLLSDIRAGGVPADAITVLMAGGTHAPPNETQARTKIGDDVFDMVSFVAHDSRRSHFMEYGRSGRGTRIAVNECFAAADLKVAIGGVFPHPAAGFSGGLKIVVPGVCCFSTAQQLHDLRSGPRGALENEFRREVNEIGTRIGLDFMVNAVINHDRELAGVFAGDPIHAHGEAVGFVRSHFRVGSESEADIVVADTYPFDTSLVWVLDRGLWPLENTLPGGTRVAVATCPLGLGGHALKLGLVEKLYHRARRFQLREFWRIGERAANLHRQIQNRRMELFMLTEGIEGPGLAEEFPRATALHSPSELTAALRARLDRSDVRVLVYRGAPLLLPD